MTKTKAPSRRNSDNGRTSASRTSSARADSARRSGDYRKRTDYGYTRERPEPIRWQRTPINDFEPTWKPFTGLDDSGTSNTGNYASTGANPRTGSSRYLGGADYSTAGRRPQAGSSRYSGGVDYSAAGRRPQAGSSRYSGGVDYSAAGRRPQADSSRYSGAADYSSASPYPQRDDFDFEARSKRRTKRSSADSRSEFTSKRRLADTSESLTRSVRNTSGDSRRRTSASRADADRFDARKSSVRSTSIESRRRASAASADADRFDSRETSARSRSLDSRRRTEKKKSGPSAGEILSGILLVIAGGLTAGCSGLLKGLTAAAKGLAFLAAKLAAAIVSFGRLLGRFFVRFGKGVKKLSIKVYITCIRPFGILLKPKVMFPGLLKWGAFAGVMFLIIQMTMVPSRSSTPFDSMSQLITSTADLAETEAADNLMIRRLYGLNAADFEGITAMVPTSNMGARELCLIKAADDESAAAALSAMEKRLESQLSSFNGYGVDQTAMLEKSIVISEGGYVIYYSGDNPDQVESAFKGAL